jgi:hypothetical protein
LAWAIIAAPFFEVESSHSRADGFVAERLDDVRADQPVSRILVQCDRCVLYFGRAELKAGCVPLAAFILVAQSLALVIAAPQPLGRFGEQVLGEAFGAVPGAQVRTRPAASASAARLPLAPRPRRA